MIELKIDADLAQYINTEELQRQAENDVKYAVKEWVQKSLKEDKIIKEDISKYILKEVNGFPFELSDELKTQLAQKIADVALNLSNWDIQYKLKIDDKIKDIYESRQAEFDNIIIEKVNEAFNKYELQPYIINEIMSDIIKEKILERKDELNLDEVVDRFISTGLERLMY